MSQLGAQSICTLDADRDGNLDLAAVGDGALVVILNNGPGTYGPPRVYNAGFYPYAVAAGDLDGDGYPDLIVANADYRSGSVGQVSVMLNDGHGVFSAPISYPGGNPATVAVADLDGDGDNDVVVANASWFFPDHQNDRGTISIFMNNGTGILSTPTTYAAGDHPWTIAVADFDHDNHPDLAIADVGPFPQSGIDSIAILRNNGDETFTGPILYAAGHGVNSLSVGDLDGDGDMDLAVANLYGDGVSILMNLGDGSFAPAANYATGDSLTSIAVGDVDGDHDKDLVVARYNYLNGSVQVLLNDSHGAFVPSTIYTIDTIDTIAWRLRPLVTADLDGDGMPDLVVGSEPLSVSILVNCGLAGPPPAAPQITAVLDAGTGSDLVVKWIQPDKSGVTDYQVYFGMNSGDYAFGSVPIEEDGQNEYHFVLNGLTEHTPYYVAVRAHNAGTGQYSAYAIWIPPTQTLETPVRPTVPVVLVHGWSGDPSMWDLTRSKLQEVGFNYVWEVDGIDPCGVAGEKDFGGNAGRMSIFLESEISSIRNMVGFDAVNTIDVVSYSMGGLISRRFIADESALRGGKRHVRRLIMLGTPNGGISNVTVGKFLCWGPATGEMTKGKMKKFNGAYRLPAGTEVFAAAGTGGQLICTRELIPVPNPFCHYGIIGSLWDCPNDGLVGEQSVYYSENRTDWAVPRANQNTGGWCHSSFGTPWVENTFAGDVNLITGWITPILLGQTPAAPMLMAGGPSDSLPQYVWDSCISVARGMPAAAAIVVDPSSVLLAMSSSDRSVSLSLQSPTGVMYDATSMDSSVVIDSTEGIRWGFIANAEAGSWVVHFQTSAMATSDGEVCLSVVTSSSVILESMMDKDYLFTSDSARVIARITENSSPVVGASVYMREVRDDIDTLATVGLNDLGVGADLVPHDGTYSAWFVPPDTGVFEMTVVATGSSGSSTPFRRVADLSAYVSLGAVPRGDINRDGVFDVMDVLASIGIVFSGKPMPNPPESIDVNCDGVADVFDVLRLINYVFVNGPAPCR